MPLPAPLIALVGPGRRAAWRRRTARRLLAALLVGAAAALFVTVVRGPAPEPRSDVVTAARALPAGAVLSAADIATASVPASLAGTAGSALTAPDMLVGRTLAGAVEAGEPLRASRLLGPSPAGSSDAVALAVPLRSTALSGAIQVGSRVDVAVAGRVVATNARVVAVSTSRTAGDEGPAGAGTGEVLLAIGRADALAVTAATGDPLGAQAPVLLLRGTGPNTQS